LWDQGYKVHFIASSDLTHYERIKRYLGQNINFYFDGNHSRRYPKEDDQIILEGLEHISKYTGTPAFFYFHLMSVHLMGIKHDAHNRYRPSRINPDYKRFVSGKFDRKVLTNRYDNGILQSDAFIEKIFTALDRKGYLSKSLVFILGDHGEGLGERGNFGHDANVYQEDIGIPILVYDEDETNYSNLEFATQIDIAPTIIGSLGLPIPKCWEGKPLLDSNIKSYS
jgi:arylsulfatase A-like enzyme